MAIVAITFELSDKTHPVIDSLRPEKPDQLIEHDVDLSELFPEGAEFYHYQGSQTAPPSIDLVNWFIKAKTLPITA